MSFATDLSGIFSTLRSAAGTAITYHRGASSVSTTAVRGTSTLEASDGVGGIQVLTSADFIVQASSLVVSGSTVTPKAGDRIKISGTPKQVFEVLTPPYRPSDAAGTHLRIFTKYVGTES